MSPPKPSSMAELHQARLSFPIREQELDPSAWSPHTTAIPDHRLQPILRPHPTFPQPIDQRFPRCFAVTGSHLPIQDFSFAATIGPEPERHEQHRLLAGSLMTLALACVQLDGVRLSLHAQPNATELHDGRHLGEGFMPCLPKQRFDLIDALIDRAQPDTALQRGTPFLAQETQTLAQPTAKEHTLIHIHPKAVVLLQDGVRANHIMPTPLAFDHGHLEPLDMAPTRL